MDLFDEVVLGLRQSLDAMSCSRSSLSSASWRVDMRCIHQKHTTQQAAPAIVSHASSVAIRGLEPFSPCTQLSTSCATVNPPGRGSFAAC
jgi:hypothetical protein